MKMKNLIIITVLIFSMISLNSACTKDEVSLIPDLQFDRNLTVVSHSTYGVDSIFYQDDELKNILVYKSESGKLQLKNKYQLDYSPEEIRVCFQTSAGADFYSFIFHDSKLMQIRKSNGALQASFYYDSDNLRYFLYYESTYNKNMSAISNIAIDSVLVNYDKTGKNIIGTKWYSNRSSKNTYELQHTSNYTYDDMNNPYKNSPYALVVNWHGFDDILSYFNTNNILSVGAHAWTYSYNESFYPVYLDISVYGRTRFLYQSE